MVDDIIQALTELKEEPGLNKSMKGCIDKIISYLKSDKELGKDKAIAEIEDMVGNNSIEPYIRTQIWNIVSMIELL